MIKACQAAIAREGATPEHLYNLGLAFQDSGDLAAAQLLYLRVIVLRPDFGLAFNNLGNLFLQQGLVPESVAALQSAVRLQPDWPDCRYGLAMALRAATRFVEAYAILHDLCAMSGCKVEHLLAAGNTALDIEEPVQAEKHFRQALSIDTKSASLTNNLGVALARQDRFYEARDQFQIALQLESNYADAYFGLACCQERLMEPLEADSNHLKALALNPRLSFIRSNRLMNQLYRSDLSAATVFEMHKAWGESMPGPLTAVTSRQPLCGRPIRIGFVSSDLAFHSISMVLPALLDHIDRKRFSLAAYAEVMRPDAMTQYYQRSFDHWVNTVNVPAETLAQQIRNDEIDVLIDLAGHTARNRLDVFALKPAPVQISWLGYPGSTGLKTIDYRITDSVADVVGQAEALHTERLLRLDPSFLCLVVPPDLPAVKLRANDKRGISFGSFNNFLKISPDVISHWSMILLKLPSSRLILKDKGFADPRFAQHVRSSFVQYGVAPEQLELRERVASHLQHWSSYDDIDIALDPFPYNGTITTFEALIMGVPVVSLLGDRHASRVGASMLTAIDAPELVAADALSYVAQAVALAQDLPRLDSYRRGLRAQVQKSVLCDAKAFAQRFGNAIEQAISG
jgi:predicted O-linked N-acetylglucosamine transferase (SPINDLY family)